MLIYSPMGPLTSKGVNLARSMFRVIGRDVGVMVQCGPIILHAVRPGVIQVITVASLNKEMSTWTCKSR